MKVLLFVSLLLVAVYATGGYGGHGDHHGDCGGDCLKACRNCPELQNDGEDTEDGKSPFLVNSRIPGDCNQAICKDPKSVLIVDGHQYKSVVCFQGKWHFGYPDFLEQTDSAKCLSPGNTTCEEDANLVFDEEFKCVCKPNFEDRAEEFGYEDGTLCSNCNNTKHNIILLVDNSGSMTEVMATVQKFIVPFVKFLKVSETGNRVALMTSDFSYDIVINFGTPASVLESSITAKVNAIVADGQSYLGSGMEAVKAAFVQPEHENDANAHKLIVFTDGSVKHAPPVIKDITAAAYKLEALKVETFVIATNLHHNETAVAIANGVEKNIFNISETEAANFKIVNRLQKRICV